MKIKLTIILIVLIASIGVITYYIVFEKNKFDVSEKKTEHKITASELFYKFESDENQANKQYLGKVIEVTGLISEIQKNQNNETLVVFKESGEIFGVTCTFSSLSDEKVLEVGATITAKGVCQGFLTDVIVNNCTLVN